MDCRKWILMGIVLSVAGSGCAWQELTSNPLSSKTTTVAPAVVAESSPPEIEPATKKTPKASTCVLAGDYYVKESTRPELTTMQREDTLRSARKAYQQALKIEATNLKAQVGLAKVYTEYKDYPRALETYQAALAKHPNEVVLWRDLAWCHGRQKNFEKAAECCRKALDIEPENRTCATTLGLFLARAGKTEQAIAILTPIHGKAQANVYVAHMMKHLGENDEANRHMQVAHRLEQSNTVPGQGSGIQQAVHQVPGSTLPQPGDVRPANLSFQQ